MDHERGSREPQSMAGVTSETLVLDSDARCIRGIDMDPLLTGEFLLLAFLGTRARVWQTSRALSAKVYHREDPGGMQLVWKYTSTLRKKLSASLPGLVEVCRRRGYRCGMPLRVVSHDASDGAAARVLPASVHEPLPRVG
ncbi:MAG TPA: winged helix-turn-helix domain-containing protein [Polyangiaceae bacterium]|nr:winged helix-turn-helix domain-containing protein [Polyangiaceae bacterium]